MWGDGSKGVDVWLGAPSIVRIYGLNLAWHWQCVCEHVHLISHYGMVRSWVLLLRLPALVNL